MSYPPFCIICGSKSNWSSDWDSESDFRYEHPGVIGHYICSSYNCNAHLEIRDFLVSDLEEERSIKYYFQDENKDGFYNLSQSEDVTCCLYCGKLLSSIESPFINQNSQIETQKKCLSCNVIYSIIDIYPFEGLCIDDDYSELYYSRTIFLK